MPVELQYLLCHVDRLTRRLQASHRLRGSGDRGAMTTEAVIVIAGLAALALAVVAIIVAKVTAKANSIPTN
jgi:hypothetical protein